MLFIRFTLTQHIAATVTVITDVLHPTPACVLQDGQEVTVQKVCIYNYENVLFPYAATCVHLGTKCYGSKNSAEVKNSYIHQVELS